MSTIDNSARITPEDVKKCLINLGQVVFEVTDDCNLSCKYCAFGDLYGGYDRRASRRMRFEEARTIIDYLVSIWKQNALSDEEISTTISFYGGEPLLNFPLIKEVVEYVESLDIRRRFNFSMTTNCFLLDKYLQFLADHEFDILCSLDGDEKSNAYRIRKDGASSFNRVFANIKLLQNTYPEYFEKHVNFNAVLHNLNSVQKAAGFIKQEFNKNPSLSELSGVDIRAEKKDLFNQTFLGLRESFASTDGYDPVLSDLFVEDPDILDLQKYIDVHVGNCFVDYIDLLQDPESTTRTPSGTCIPFLRKMFVKVDGKIMQCERIPHRFAIGEVKDGVVHLDVDHIARWFNAFLDRIQKQCLICSRKPECPVCLFQMNGIDLDDYVCEDFMTDSEYERFCDARKVYLMKHPELYQKILEQFILR